MKITAKHQALMRAIRKDPNSSLRELGKTVGINSTSTVDYYIKTLMLEGWIRKGNKWEIVDSNQART